MIRTNVGSLVALALLLGAGSVFAATKPNVLVILSDDQGWADIGYNNPKVFTPHLDKLAATGATLTHHYVMPQCTPTRVAFFTGRYPGRFGVSGLQASNRPIIPHGTLTMATFLKGQGYETYLTGKWHLGSWAEHGPNHHGFDYSYGALAGAVGAYDHRYRVSQDHPNAVTWHRNHEIIPGYENGRHVTDLITEDAIKVIQKERESPFFLYLPYFAPHTPLDERGSFVDRPTQLDPAKPDRWLNEDDIEWFNDPEGIIQQEPDPEKRLFLAVLYHLDDAIGKVIQALDESGQRENTIVFFSSDNSPQINWGGKSYPADLKVTHFNQPMPFRGSKCDVWEGGVRVPGFVNWPGKIAPKKIDSVQHIIDWIPTVAGLLGGEAKASEDQPALDGEDFSAALLSDKTQTKEPRELYMLHRERPDKWMLRWGDWKVVSYSKKHPESGQWQLFDLSKDANEKKNLASSFPEKVQSLHARFLAQRAKDKSGHNFPEWTEPKGQK